MVVGEGDACSIEEDNDVDVLLSFCDVEEEEEDESFFSNGSEEKN